MIKPALIFAIFLASLYGQNTYNITTFAVPGALLTNAGDLSDAGVVVGTYLAKGEDGKLATFGFLRSPDGTFTTLAPPGATRSVTAYDITSQGEVYGYYTFAPNVTQSFAYRDGKYRLISINGQSTEILGGNDNGAFTGWYAGYSFLSRPGQPLIELQAPGQQETEGSAMNDNGALVGVFYNDYGEQETTSGFELIGGKYINIDVPPGNDSTAPYSINNDGVIVGTYIPPKDTATHGFIYQDGQYHDFFISGSTQTFLAGCNSQGVLTGSYADANNKTISFIATPVQ